VITELKLTPRELAPNRQAALLSRIDLSQRAEAVEHLLVMPVTPLEIMAAKILANSAVIIVPSLVSLQFVVRGLLGVPIIGSVPLFISGAIRFMFSVTSPGILLATFARTIAQFGLLAGPVIVILYLLSGSATPLETMPGWLQAIMQLTPNTQFVALLSDRSLSGRRHGFDVASVRRPRTHRRGDLLVEPLSVFANHQRDELRAATWTGRTQPEQGWNR